MEHHHHFQPQGLATSSPSNSSRYLTVQCTVNSNVYLTKSEARFSLKTNSASLFRITYNKSLYKSHKNKEIMSITQNYFLQLTKKATFDRASTFQIDSQGKPILELHLKFERPIECLHLKPPSRNPILDGPKT